MPDVPKYILIAAPHTSNWDFLWAMSMAITLRVKLNWLGKHTLFKPVVGPLLQRWGGIPIRRNERSNRVDMIADKIRRTDAMVLLVPVEGTRGYTEYWKSGFYHIATTAGVPVVLGYLDYARRRGGFGPMLIPKDLDRDMLAIRTFYLGFSGKHSHLAGPVRLKEETG